MYEYIFPLRDEHRKRFQSNNLLVQSMNNADSIIDNNDQKFKLNQTSDTNISRITYHTDLNLSNDNVNLSESSSFQYFDTSYLHGVMKPIIIRRPAPPPPPLPPKTSIEKESNEMIIMMNDDISTIYSETIDSNSPLDLSTNDNYSSNYTIQSSSSSSMTNDDKKELYRSNLSTINLHSTDIKSHLLNNTTSLSNHQNHSSMISFSNSLPSTNYATYSIRNKNFNDDHYHNDDHDDGDSIDNKQQQSSLNIYKSNDDDDNDNSYLADKLMLMNDSTFLGIEDNVVTNNHKNNDEKKIQTNNNNDYKSFRCISRLVFIFIVLVAIVLALFLIIQLIIRDYLHHHHHQKQQNDYQQQYSQYQWPYGWYNLTYLDQQQPMTAIYY